MRRRRRRGIGVIPDPLMPLNPTRGAFKWCVLEHGQIFDCLLPDFLTLYQQSRAESHTANLMR